MQKLRIAILISSIANGGSERFATVLADGMNSRGHEVHLLTGEKQEDDYVISPDVKRVVLGTSEPSVGNMFRYAGQFKRYIQDNKIDVCVAINIFACFIAGLVNSSSLKAKMVLCERNSPAHDNLSWKTKLLRSLLFRRGDAYVFQTPGAQAFYSKDIQERGVVIANPLKEGLPMRNIRHKKQIVAVGRLNVQKNYPMLLDAFAEACKSNDEYSLHIFGKGELDNELRNQAKQLNIQDRVVFEGYSLDFHEKMKDGDIYVLSSDFEGLSNALMEAMAMGFPVISTDHPCGGARMIIQDGINGLLTPVGDAHSMANAILRLIEDPEEKESIAKSAAEVAVTYSVDNILNQWDQFLIAIK